MPLALLALALALAANVLLGPLGLQVLVWRVSPVGLNQTYGADAASLLLVVPAALAAAALWRRQHRLAAPLALSVGLATLYYAVAEVLGPDYLRYPGNNERFFLLFLALIVLSWATSVRAWAALDPAPPRPGVWLARGFGSVLLLAAATIAFAWLSQLVDLAVHGTLSAPADAAAYLDAPSAFWTIRIVDLGFIVPMSVWTGVGLWRGNDTAVKLSFALAGFLTLQSAAVLCMGAVMLWRQDPTASPTLVYALVPITAALAGCTVRLLGTYLRSSGPETGYTCKVPLCATRSNASILT